MSGRNSLAAGLIALSLGAPAASAQQVAAAPLAPTDPWGVGWLGRADGALPTTFWSNTDAATLTPLLADLKPASLAPSARLALRRVMLSGAKGPAGDADLIPERLRLIEQLGESERAIDLRRRFPKAAWSAGADRLASDMDLVAGRNETACARVADKRADDPAWMPVRALCYAAAKDHNAAGMVAEQTLDKDGKPDVWLIQSIETIREPTKTKPAGRYGSPFEAAVSVAAKLSVPSNAMVGMPGDVALAIARHPTATFEQKRAAMRIAVDTGRLTSADVTAALATPREAAPAATAQRSAAQRPAPDFLTLALEAAAKTDMTAEAKSAAYAAALKAGDNPADARIAALALTNALKSLAKTQATLPNAETFARAALVAGDTKLAQDWRKLLDLADGEHADLWAEARLDLILSFAGINGDKSTEPLQRLVAALPPMEEKPAKLSAAAQRQLDLRRVETARVMFLYVGAGRPLPPAGRAQLASQRNAGRGVADAALARIQSAAEADADGEAALAAIAQLGPDVSAVSFSGLADLLTLLRRTGLQKEAEAIALESLQAWKAL